MLGSEDWGRRLATRRARAAARAAAADHGDLPAQGVVGLLVKVKLYDRGGKGGRATYVVLALVLPLPVVALFAVTAAVAAASAATPVAIAASAVAAAVVLLLLFSLKLGSRCFSCRDRLLADVTRISGLCRSPSPAPHGAVPSVLNSVVCPSRHHLCNLGPLIAEFRLHLDDDAVLFLSPTALLDVGVKVVVPALAALLSRTSPQSLGNSGPLRCAMDGNEILELDVLVATPAPLGARRFLLNNDVAIVIDDSPRPAVALFVLGRLPRGTIHHLAINNVVHALLLGRFGRLLLSLDSRWDHW
mmetsp:Transcript_10221/g.20968  ORF Transcript_10221/g.20968 Transcript_10221/m.20968 type:complete len:302 (-) Transcript_10221:398-1303(-)